MLFLAVARRLELLYSTCNAVLSSCMAFRILLNYLMKSKTAISYRSLSWGAEIVNNTIVKDTIAGKNLHFLSFEQSRKRPFSDVRTAPWDCALGLRLGTALKCSSHRNDSLVAGCWS